MQRVEASETWKFVGLGSAVKLEDGDHIDPGRLVAFAKSVGAHTVFGSSEKGKGFEIILVENGKGPKSQTACRTNKIPKNFKDIFRY